MNIKIRYDKIKDNNRSYLVVISKGEEFMTSNLTEQVFLKPLLVEAERLGTVTTKKSFFGGTVIFIDKTKIGGLIKDNGSYLFQFKPTKSGEHILQDYLRVTENFGKHDISFTFKTLTGLSFLPQLVKATFEELKK